MNNEKVKGYRLKLIGLSILCSLLIAQVRAEDSILSYPLDTLNGEEVYKYEVERSIGLYRIGKNFNVPQADIIRLNPQLRERGLHFGETLYIPTGRPVTVGEKPITDKSEESMDTVRVITVDTIIHAENALEAVINVIQTVDSLIQTDTVVIDTLAHILPDTTVLVLTDSVDGKPVLELALLLPFESQQTKRSATAERMMEFYQGALLALHDLQNDSLIYRLRVYDVERSERRITSLCDSTELNKVRGILGPVYPIQIERLVMWSDSNQVPILLPFSDDVDLRTRTHLLQFNASDIQKADSLCAWMIARDSMQHCVTIDVKDADMSASIRTLRKQMKANKIKSSNLVLRDLIADSAAYALDIEKENLIILHSDRYQHVRILLPHLSKLQDQGYRLRIVSQYSWQKENIDLPQVYTSMFTAEADREAYDTLWEKAYVTNHTSDAPRFDLLGYDLMRALVAWLNGEKETNGLQADIRWTQVGEGGWQNTGVKVIER